MPLAQNITVIPAIRKVGTQKPETKVQKTRVAAYCRVSTEYEEQESSYDVQVEHYTTYIKSKPEWEFVEVYADDGISGTNTKKRDEWRHLPKNQVEQSWMQVDGMALRQPGKQEEKRHSLPGTNGP